MIKDLRIYTHKNREEIIDLLFYLKNEELVELRDWSSYTKRGCGLIRLNFPKGREYLAKLS